MVTLVQAGLPVGAIIPFGGAIGNIPVGFLLCNGASINRNDFSDLFNAIGTNWGTVDGLTFNLPTTQGLTLKGQDNGAGNDPDAVNRIANALGGSIGDAVGTRQNWTTESHGHTSTLAAVAVAGTYNGTVTGAYGNLDGALVNTVYNAGGDVNVGPVSQPALRGANGTSTSNDTSPNASFEASSQRYRLQSSLYGGLQTTGSNVAVNFIIKY